MNEYVKWAMGNMGALEFLATLVDPSNAMVSLPIILTIHDIPSLRGTNLYVLWSDLGNRDLQLVAALCRNVPADVLADACSRQDYSGRDMVRPYLKSTR